MGSYRADPARDNIVSDVIPQASRSDGYLAVEIIAGLVLISCLFFVRSFRWLFRGTTDRVRTYVFVLSIIATIMYAAKKPVVGDDFANEWLITLATLSWTSATSAKTRKMPS